MSGMLQIRRNATALVAIVVLFALAIGVAFFIVRHQRLRLPYDPIYTLTAEMPTGQALTPGQGQSATVAGVRVGEISRVRLRDGRALVDMALDRRKLPEGDLRTDAHLLVRPRTPLQDMTVDIDPGSPGAPRLAKGAVLDVSQTTPPVNVDEILAALDSDTRAWLQTMLQASGRALHDRGGALRAALRAAAPTFEEARRVSDIAVARRSELARAIHNLRLLTGAIARQDHGVEQLVAGGNATFAAFASESGALRNAVAQLPQTLDAGARAVAAARPLAKATGPALRSLVPTAHALPAALHATDPLLVSGRPALRDLSKLARKAAPIAKRLQPALGDLNAATPDLTASFSVLRRLMNELSYVPAAPDHGYLFWLAWFAHNLNNFQGGEDANGGFWHGSVIFSCSAGLNQPILVGAFGPLLSQLDGICPQSPVK